MRNHLEDIHADEDDNEINLTPMLDVVFIMLIFFIVTASFLQVNSGVDGTKPPDSVRARVNSLKTKTILGQDLQPNDAIIIDRCA